MSLTPGYGETPLGHEEFTALLPAVRNVLGKDPTKAAIYDLEQAIQDEAAEDLLTAVIDGGLILDELLVDHFVRDLHLGLYRDIWQWAGKFRNHEFNIGIAPEHIATTLRQSIDSIRYRWENNKEWTARELGIAVHAETVRIHPFTDGNGRTTRLWADLIFAAAQDSDDIKLYDWRVDKHRYIGLLREYDHHRGVHDLTAFVGVKPLGK